MSIWKGITRFRKEFTKPQNLCLLLTTFVIFLPVRSGLQLIFVSNLCIAFFSMWLWGLFFARKILKVSTLGFFSLIYIGQFVFWTFAIIATALNKFLILTHFGPLTLFWITCPATLTLAIFEARSKSIVLSQVTSFSVNPFFLMALGSATTVMSIYSSHLSSLGLDIHQHIAWTEQILWQGMIPLTEPSTMILGDYPHSFHLFAALWTAAGFASVSGPFVKVMPFLTNALPMLSLGELLVNVSAKRHGTHTRIFWEVSMGLAFWMYAFFLVPLVYPVWGLQGTARYSSNSILLLPIILIVITHYYQAPRAAAMSIGILPLLAGWSLTYNPIVLIELVVVTIPMMVLSYAVFRPAQNLHFKRLTAFITFTSCLLSLLVIFQDPFIVSQVAAKSPRISGALEKQGLLTFEEAVQRGMATPREKSVKNVKRSIECDSVDCFKGIAFDATQKALYFPIQTVRSAYLDLRHLFNTYSSSLSARAFVNSLPVQPANVKDHAAIPLISIILAAIFICILTQILSGSRKAFETIPDWMLITFFSGLVVAGIGLQFVAALATMLNDQSHERAILASYLSNAGSQVSTGFFWMIFAPSWAILCRSILPCFFPIRCHMPQTAFDCLRIIALCFWIFLPLIATLNLQETKKTQVFFSKIVLEDIAALRRVESLVAPQDGILVPAEHWNIADWEHWVIPVGDAAALLPYGRARYLFNVYLGASYPFSWRDLEERLCSKDPEIRTEFLTRAQARYILVRDRLAFNGNEAAKRTKFCGASLYSFGIELPPIIEERGIYLFEIKKQ